MFTRSREEVPRRVLGEDLKTSSSARSYWVYHGREGVFVNGKLPWTRFEGGGGAPSYSFAPFGTPLRSFPR